MRLTRRFLLTVASFLLLLCSPATTSAGTTANAFGTRNVVSPQPYDPGHIDKFRGMADVDGDGRADYCRFVGNRPNVYLSCGLSNGKTFGNTDVNSANGYDAGWKNRFRGMADVNNDGRADYCRFVGKPNVFLSCGLSKDKTFGNNDVNSASGYNAGLADTFRGMVDVNADGRADYCRFVGGVFKTNHLSCGLSDGKTFGDDDVRGDFDAGDPTFRAMADVDGDSRADYCRFVDTYLSCSLSDGKTFGNREFNSSKGIDRGWPGTQMMGDVNGDRRADFCRRVGDFPNILISCALAGTTGFGEQFEFSSIPGYEFGNEKLPYQLADVNADRKADFCQFFGADRGFQVMLSAGLSTQGGVVNMIPASLSGEEHQDSEPFLSVHPSNSMRMSASALTPNPAGADSTTAPIFVTVDEGATWTLNAIVPGSAVTGDITHAFDQDGSLFAGILNGLVLNELMTRDFTARTAMTVQNKRGAPEKTPDQPFVQAERHGGVLTVVGNNDLGEKPRTATVDVTSDGGKTYSSVRIEKRDTCGQNGPAIRPAIAVNNRVYAGFFGWRDCRKIDENTLDIRSDVVIVRDDSGGTSGFQSLKGTDGLAGVQVVTGISIRLSNKETLGRERIGSSLSVAVHPGNDKIVYVAWCDGGSDKNHPYTLRVRRSVDGGETWTSDGLLTAQNAINPALAVSARGTLACLYQQLNGSQWVTYLLQITSTGITTKLTLADVTNRIPEGLEKLPYLGDYAFVMAVGNEFRGVFSAPNSPWAWAFPSGVTFQRIADFGTFNAGTRKLSNGTGGETQVSIDPYYFHVADAGGTP